MNRSSNGFSTSSNPSNGAALSEVASIIRSFPLFSGLDPTALQHVANCARRVNFREGAAIWHAGEEAESALLITRGFVQIFRAVSVGEDATIGLFGPKEMVGLNAVLDGPGYPASAAAVSDEVTGLRVSAQCLRMLRDNNIGFAHALNAVLLGHIRVMRAKIDVLTSGEVHQRLAALLIQLSGRFGDEQEDGSHEVSVPLSRRMLARLVGARVETVIRVMRRWEDEGLVQTHGEGFSLLRPEAFAQLASVSA